jgi:hypothetical protein
MPHTDVSYAEHSRSGRASSRDPWYPLSRSDAECCHAAAGLGLLNNVSGALICCDGRLVPCASPALSSKYTNQTALRIITACVIEHETTHVYQVTTANCTIGGVKEATADSSVVIIHELVAHMVEMNCLIKHLDECGFDMECRQQVMAKHGQELDWYREYLRRLVQSREQQANACKR